MQMPRENVRQKRTEAGPEPGVKLQGLRVRRLAEYDQKIEELLGSLFGQLKGMPAHSREKSLRQLFSQPQRLALERFVQRGGAAHLPASVTEAKRASTAKAALKCGGLRRGDTPPPRPTEKARHLTDRLSRPLGLTFNRQRNGCYYRCQVQIGYLRIVSRSWRSLAPAEAVRCCLQALRERLKDSGRIPDDFANAFAEALPLTLAEHGLTCAGAGLRLYISFKPRCASENLCSRPYDLAKEAELRRGLAAFKALGAAKAALGPDGEAWTHLRDTFAEAMAAARGTKKQLKRNIAIVDAAEERSHAKEERQQAVRARALLKEQGRQERQQRLRAKRQPELTRPERAVRRLLRRWASLDAARGRALEIVVGKAVQRKRCVEMS